MNIIIAARWLYQNVMNPMRRRKEIFIATKGETVAVPRRSKTLRDKWHPEVWPMKHCKSTGQNREATGLLCLDGATLILAGFVLFCIM